MTTVDPRAPRGILLYGMYDLTGGDTAPKVRIGLMRDALARKVPLEVIVGGRWARAGRATRWLLSGRWQRVAAVYVESATSSPTPADLAFLATMRLLGRPVGTYFRDAYQLFRDVYPRTRRRQIVADAAWRVLNPMLRAISSRRFVPTVALGEVLGIRDPILLPPAADAAQPDLGAGALPLVGYVGGFGWADGFDRLLGAMEILRQTLPEARLRVVGPAISAERAASLPAWVELERGGRAALPALLRHVRVCVIPRPVTAYTDLAIPVKVWDYLSLGKPIVTTATRETRAIVERSGGGLVTADSPDAIAEGLRRVLVEPGLAPRLAVAARAFAESPDQSWDDRADRVIEALGLEPAQ